MFKQLFFCCHEKGDKDDFSSINVDIENNSNINSKNIDILNSKNNIDKSCRPLNTNSKKRLYLKYSNKSLTKVAEENKLRKIVYNQLNNYEILKEYNYYNN